MLVNKNHIFLPTNKKEVEQRGWSQLDVILFTGDAYVDHPSFGIAVIARVLENIGLKVAVVPQPNWQDDLRDFKKLGTPRLFFGVSSGNMDSMVNHYTANKRLRSNDAFTPGDKAGFRPDYATSIYANILKKLFPETPIVIGGIEASLRRFTHYDFWSDTLKQPILVDSKADILVYGMGEKAIVEIAKRLESGENIHQLQNIPQTAYISKKEEYRQLDEIEDIIIASFEQCMKSKTAFAQAFTNIEEESNKYTPKRLVEPVDDGLMVVNPAYPPSSTEELDAIYKLPFTRLPHPKYAKKGDIPAFEMIKFSVNIHRGCFGGCSFCTISAHQGKFISSRSEKSIIEELETINTLPDFKGHISDLGGPSANMYRMQGFNLDICKKCKRPSCIWPAICNNLNHNHAPLVDLYKKARNLPFIKKATIGSGIRYDLFAENTPTNKTYKTDLITHHISGRLKVAPEHTCDKVLQVMRKPSFDLFKKFNEDFMKINAANNLKQQLVPYFISSHPGCTIDDMRQLKIDISQINIQPEQVQDFTPTPMTLASVMYYTGLDPYTLKPLFVARKKEDKLAQKDLFFWKKR